MLATDLDITQIGELSGPNLEVRVHDVMVDELPAGRVRRDPHAAAAGVAGGAAGGAPAADARRSSRAGGWWPRRWTSAPSRPIRTWTIAACGLFARVAPSHNAALAARSGFDAYYGRRVAGDFADAGLVDVARRGPRVDVARRRGRAARIWKLTVSQLRDDMVDLSSDEVDHALELFDDRQFSSLSPVVMAASGRRG